MKRGLTLVLSAAFAVVVVGLAVADSQKQGSKCCGEKSACCSTGQAALKCPVSGEDISKDVSTAYKGGKVYFCCPACIAKFKDHTAKYQAKANEQLVLSGQFKQVACPLSGKKLNPATKTKVDGIDVCFCCKKCQGMIKGAAAGKQCQMVFVKGFDKGFKLAKATKKEKK